MAFGNVIEEYLVSLGFEIDTPGLARFRGTMERVSREVEDKAGRMSGIIAKSVGAAGIGVASLAAGVIGLANHVAKKELDFQIFGLKMYMATDAAKRLKIATDALGYSIDDIAWNPELYGQYKQLVKDQVQLQGMLGEKYKENMLRIREINGEFTRMRVIGTYLAEDVISKIVDAFGGFDAVLDKLRELNHWLLAEGGFQKVSGFIADHLVPILKTLKGIILDVSSIFLQFMGAIYNDAQLKEGKNSLENYVRVLDHIGDTLKNVQGYLDKFINTMKEHPDAAKWITAGLLGDLAIKKVTGTSPIGAIAGGAVDIVKLMGEMMFMKWQTSTAITAALGKGALGAGAGVAGGVGIAGVVATVVTFITGLAELGWAGKVLSDIFRAPAWKIVKDEFGKGEIFKGLADASVLLSKPAKALREERLKAEADEQAKQDRIKKTDELNKNLDDARARAQSLSMYLESGQVPFADVDKVRSELAHAKGKIADDQKNLNELNKQTEAANEAAKTTSTPTGGKSWIDIGLDAAKRLKDWAVGDWNAKGAKLLAEGAKILPALTMQSSKMDIQAAIAQRAALKGVPPILALATAAQESGFKPGAMGSKGDTGLFQLMPATAAGLGVNPKDINENIEGGIKYLKQLFDRFHDWRIALEAYNRGPGRVMKEIKKYGQLMNTSYSDKVLAHLKEFPSDMAALENYKDAAKTASDASAKAKQAHKNIAAKTNQAHKDLAKAGALGAVALASSHHLESSNDIPNITEKAMESVTSIAEKVGLGFLGSEAGRQIATSPAMKRLDAMLKKKMRLSGIDVKHFGFASEEYGDPWGTGRNIPMWKQPWFESAMSKGKSELSSLFGAGGSNTTNVGGVTINIMQPNATPDQIKSAVIAGVDQQKGRRNQRAITQGGSSL